MNHKTIEFLLALIPSALGINYFVTEYENKKIDQFSICFDTPEDGYYPNTTLAIFNSKGVLGPYSLPVNVDFVGGAQTMRLHVQWGNGKEEDSEFKVFVNPTNGLLYGSIGKGTPRMLVISDRGCTRMFIHPR